MSIKKEITLELQFQFTMRTPKDFYNVVQLQIDTLPEYIPTKWGYTEPLKNIFDPKDISILNPQNAYNIMESAYWKRTGENRAYGGWYPRRDLEIQSKTVLNHASTVLNVYDASNQEKLIFFAKSTSTYFPINFGFIEAITERYKPYGAANGIKCYDILAITTHILRHWLPDILWCSVFGPDYINFFGKERLLSAPAYKVELLNDEAVFLQLTPDINDLWVNFDMVMDAREEVKRHLGYEAFYRKELAYDWQKHPEKAGQVFRVPTFNFIEDGTQPLSALAKS
jgi:hypothetical protein